MTFAPANGSDVDPTEVFFQSDTPLTYDNLTVTNATEIAFGVINIQTRSAQASDFTLTNSSMSATSNMVIGAGSTLRLDASSSLTTVDFDNFGTLAGNGTVNAFNFNVRNGAVLSPGSSIGTLNINSAISFAAGSTILSEVDPAAGKLVKLKFYAGLSLQDAAASMNLTRRQGDRLWAYARAWLYDHLRHG